ncbi:MAG TPA: hypothetical protein VHQ41_02110 [Patescibacteria group bacterium]|jgi:hypothetical protein|nr:hypothetical protein [Patescibacteria group bacterium]
MQLKPKPWTHHHAHRLFHISMGLCFGFAALVLVAGMGTYWVTAGAVSSVSQDLDITATVAGINPGPVTPPSTSGSRVPVPSANPTITITAEPQGLVPQRNITAGGNTVPAYVFDTRRPAFSGTTSVSNGLIFIYIEGPRNVNTTARASADGKWLWQSPDQLPFGTYAITAVVYDSYNLTNSASAKTYFIIQTPPAQPGQPAQPGKPSQPGGSGSGNGTPGQPGTPSEPGSPEQPPVIPAGNLNTVFGIFYEILPQYKSIETGGQIISWVTLVSNADQSVANQDITYQVISPDNKVVLQTTDTVSFSKQVQYMKTFNIAPMTPPGTYTIRISSKYNGIESMASDTFVLREAQAPIAAIGQGPAVIWSLLILLLILFLILVIIAYRYVRRHTRELEGYNAPESTAPPTI